MRKELAKSDGERKKFSGVFSRIGSKKNYKGYSEPTVLLTSIKDLETNTQVADHVWFSLTKGFEDAGLKEGKEGAVVVFEARIKEYKKGYVNKAYKINQQKIDYKLSHPTKIKLM
ncbi:MAG: hypothetical protein HOP08_04700 [Cyclobacteriaceae bacterium]|nr:hypothetical protein [Cyclobacteriaceae bacterium]